MTSQAWNKAEEKFAFAQRQVARMQNDRNAAQKQLTAKVARLRALRLAKESADKEAAAREALPKASASSRR
jgi:hypothetical protein